MRFRLHIGERLGVGPGEVEANVAGEHGTSSVFLWSTARIGGMPVCALLGRRGIEFDAFREAVEEDVRFANMTGRTVSLPSIVGRQGVIECWSQRCSTRNGKAWSVVRYD
jgi:malate/lactate dehydrogenase-like protein